MSKVYGYCRISTPKQNIERQIRNILIAYPTAKLFSEVYTGRKLYERKEFDKLLRLISPGDTIVFDSVSRMSRNADEGIELYLRLYDEGINLVFLKESYINTDTYKSALSNSIELTGDDVDDILIGVNSYLKKLATKQIRLAFEQAEKEVTDLQQRTREGIVTARANGKQIGQRQGKKLNVKKEAPTKELIKKFSRDFNGSLTDKETIKLIGIARNTYYKYKKEITEGEENADCH